MASQPPARAASRTAAMCCVRSAAHRAATATCAPRGAAAGMVAQSNERRRATNMVHVSKPVRAHRTSRDGGGNSLSRPQVPRVYCACCIRRLACGSTCSKLLRRQRRSCRRAPRLLDALPERIHVQRLRCVEDECAALEQVRGRRGRLQRGGESCEHVVRHARCAFTRSVACRSDMQRRVNEQLSVGSAVCEVNTTCQCTHTLRAQRARTPARQAVQVRAHARQVRRVVRQHETERLARAGCEARADVLQRRRACLLCAPRQPCARTGKDTTYAPSSAPRQTREPRPQRSRSRRGRRRRLSSRARAPPALRHTSSCRCLAGRTAQAGNKARVRPPCWQGQQQQRRTRQEQRMTDDE